MRPTIVVLTQFDVVLLHDILIKNSNGSPTPGEKFVELCVNTKSWPSRLKNDKLRKKTIKNCLIVLFLFD